VSLKTKKGRKGKVPQHEREELRYVNERRKLGGSYISKRKPSNPMCPFVNKRTRVTKMKDAGRRILKDM